jgi:hypothetical protein
MGPGGAIAHLRVCAIRDAAEPEIMITVTSDGAAMLFDNLQI